MSGIHQHLKGVCNMSFRRIHRRDFLKAAGALAGVAAMPQIVPSSALGADGATVPSERIGLGVIGLGIQGTGNMRAFLGNSEVRVAAVCDVHQTQREKGKKVVDDWYSNADCAMFDGFREMMAGKDIDAVQITVPDHWHPLMAVEAARRKKHMYCEKPMGWSFRAAKAVQKAVHDSGVVFQFGTQQRSGGFFRQACELVRNNKIGPLKTMLVGVPGSWTCPKQPAEPVPPELDYEMWLGPAPMAPYCYERCRPYTDPPKNKFPGGWGPWSNWYCISDYCMGMIGNWGVHHLDIAQWGNNTDLSGPIEIEGAATFPQDMLTDCSTNWQVRNLYANGVTMIHMDDATAKEHPQQVEGYGHGVLFIGPDGWVHVDRERITANPKSLLKWRPGPNDVRLLRSDNHQANFVDAVKGRTQPAAPIDIALRSDTLCNLENIATLLKRKLQWDPVKEAFMNDDEANQMLDRPMRDPWRL